MFDLMILAPIGAVAALAYAFILSRRVMAQSEGTDLMKKIAASIRSGANAYLKRQYKGVSVFFVIMGVVLFALVFAGLVNVFVPVAFVVGGFFSGLSGFLGMRIATNANARTANAAQHSLNSGLKVAFSAGAVMGFTVVGLGMLETSLWYYFLRFYYSARPVDQQAQMIKDWYPDATNVGLLYCSGEANSQYQVDTVQVYLEELGYTFTQYPFSDSNDMASVVQTCADNSDVIYVPTDNTCASNTGIIDNICRPAGIPVFAGEEGIAKGCGVATLSISYYDLGVATGKMAAKILTGESNVSEMPIEYAPQFTKKYNADICADLGITPPEGYEAIA